jgi:hypothetical protein
MIGAPYTVICNSCDAQVFKIPADEFQRKIFGLTEIDTKKYLMVVNLQAKFKAIESKTQCLQYYNSKLFSDMDATKRQVAEEKSTENSENKTARSKEEESKIETVNHVD